MSVTEIRLQSNGIQFHAFADGPESGPLVVLLHGFPELARSWLPILPTLAAAGYRAVAPDLRGYGETDVTGPYDLPTLAADTAGLIRALGREKAIVVGHDWGGGVAWGTAFLQPQVVERLVIMNCPHPAILGKSFLGNFSQLKKSWYMFFFQVPWLPEWLLTRNGAAAVAKSLRGGSTVRDVWTREALKPYRDAFIPKGRASAAIGYYRASFRAPFATDRAAKKSPITAPTHIIWGVEDQFLGKELISIDVMRPYFAAGNEPTIEFIQGAGHFVQSEAPGKVSDTLLKWLGPTRG